MQKAEGHKAGVQEAGVQEASSCEAGVAHLREQEVLKLTEGHEAGVQEAGVQEASSCEAGVHVGGDPRSSSGMSQLRETGVGFAITVIHVVV